VLGWSAGAQPCPFFDRRDWLSLDGMV